MSSEEGIAAKTEPADEHHYQNDMRTTHTVFPVPRRGGDSDHGTAGRNSPGLLYHAGRADEDSEEVLGARIEEAVGNLVRIWHEECRCAGARRCHTS